MKASLLAELEAARLVFHALLNSLSNEDLRRESRNPAWTNQQILFHMALGFFLLPSLILILLLFGRLPRGISRRFADLLDGAARPFNAVNALGPQYGGKAIGPDTLSAIFDRVYGLIVRLARALPEEEWTRGMYYPAKWDPLFKDYMTLAEVFHFPIRHFYFHVGQITQSEAPA